MFIQLALSVLLLGGGQPGGRQPLDVRDTSGRPIRDVVLSVDGYVLARTDAAGRTSMGTSGDRSKCQEVSIVEPPELLIVEPWDDCVRAGSAVVAIRRGQPRDAVVAADLLVRLIRQVMSASTTASEPVLFARDAAAYIDGHYPTAPSNWIGAVSPADFSSSSRLPAALVTGSIAFLHGNSNAAAESLADAVKIIDERTDPALLQHAQLTLAVVLNFRGDTARAYAALTEAVRLGPFDTLARFWQARVPSAMSPTNARDDEVNQVFEQELTKQHPNAELLARILRMAATANLADEEYRDAAVALDKAVESLTAAGLGDGLSAAHSYAQRANVYDRINNGDASAITARVSLRRKAARIFRVRLGAEDATTLQVLALLAFSLDEAGSADEAVAIVRDVIDTRTKVSGGDPIEIAYDRMILGNAHASLGRFEDARTVLKQAISALEQRTDSPTAREDLVVALRYLAQVELSDGHIPDAKGAIARANDLARQWRLRQDTEMRGKIARVIDGVASGADRASSEYGKALALASRHDFVSAINIAEPLLADDMPARRRATLMNALSSWYYELSDYGKARILADSAMQTLPDSDEPDMLVATIKHDAAVAYRALGMDAQAVQLQRRAAEIKEQIAMDRSAPAAEYAGLGYSALAARNIADAEIYFSKCAQRSNEATVGWYVGRCLEGLARVQASKGRLADAEQSLQALVSSLGTGGPQTAPVLSSALASLANVEADLGKHAAAKDAIRRARAALPNGASTLGLSLILAREAMLTAWASGKPCDATADAVEYRKLTQTLFENAMSSGSSRMDEAFASAAAAEFDAQLSFHLQGCPSSRETAAVAFDTIVNEKSITIDAARFIRESLRTKAPTVPLAPAELAAAYQHQATLVHRDIRNVARSDVQEWRRSAAQVEDVELTAAAVQAFSDRHLKHVDAAVIRAQFDPADTLVEYAVYRPVKRPLKFFSDNTFFDPPRYAAYVMRRNGSISWKDLGAADAIDALAGKIRTSMDRPDAGLPTELRQLYDVVVAPIAHTFGPGRLIIDPDGGLHTVSFAALQDASGHFLVESHAIRYVSSARSMITPAQSSGGQSLIVGNLNYGRAPSTTQPILDDAACRLRFRPLFPQLSFGPDEVRKLQGTIGGARVIDGDAATAEAMLAIRSPRILHLATHGVLLASSGVAGCAGQLYEAWLALSNANVPTVSGNMVSAAEISAWDLAGTELVFVASCRSGEGPDAPRSAPKGLRGAFEIAGAKRVVASLWTLDDEAAREISLAFYDRLAAGADATDALQVAQRDWLRRAGTEARAHPYYWAGLTISGAGGPVGRPVRGAKN